MTNGCRPVSLAAVCVVLVLWAAGVAGAGNQAPDDAPADWKGALAHLRLGRLVTTPGATVMTLKLAPEHQVPLEAFVGLDAAQVEVMELPGPAGVWHVRIANREALPLFLPAGETLLTPAGPSRSTDRPIWIAPHAATFVPVVQASATPPSGPYLSRGRGLTPLEEGLVDLELLARRIRSRNLRMGVPAHRHDDAAAAYATPRFQEHLKRYRLLLGGLADGQRVVGVMVADDRGIYTAHVQPDAARFARTWPALLEGIALDAAMVEAAGLEAKPSDLGAFETDARRLLGALERDPARRPNFGVGWEVLWPVAGEHARWQGLLLPDGLVVLSLHRDPPRPAAKGGGGVPGGGGTSGGGGGGESGTSPGLVELARRGPRNAFEARLLERRTGLRPGARTPARTPGRAGGAARSPSSATPGRASGGGARTPGHAPAAPAGGGGARGGGSAPAGGGYSGGGYSGGGGAGGGGLGSFR